uniref:Uncharacterized protein n=1 Tax=Aegilops tauschii subsp. strangulata TaxID=200361 RepID=A0A453QLF4_AEGTS
TWELGVGQRFSQLITPAVHPQCLVKGQGPPWKLATGSSKEIHPTRTSSSLSPAPSHHPRLTIAPIPLFIPAHLRIICSSPPPASSLLPLDLRSSYTRTDRAQIVS